MAQCKVVQFCPEITRNNRKTVNKYREVKPDVEIEASKFKFSCALCSARSCCRGLCPPMEWLVSQVEYEPSRETEITSTMEQSISEAIWPQPPTTKQLVGLYFFYDRKTVTEIAKILYVSQQYVSKIIKEYMSLIGKKDQKAV